MGSTFLLGPGNFGTGPRSFDSGASGNSTPTSNPNSASRRGFAAMDPEKQRQIASEGGRASHLQGTAHEWSSAEAAAAGRKGGRASHGGGRKTETGEQQLRESGNP